MQDSLPWTGGCCLSVPMSNASVATDDAQRPLPGRNNVWYRNNASNTVIVFVHGVLSDSSSCWLNQDTKPPVYWPSLVARDKRFDNADIFLGGYYTSVDAGRYDLRNSANELLNAIKRTDQQGRDPVLSRRNIIFVCHSTGGIVVRHILVNQYALLSEKTIGLVLIASPSYGSGWANLLGFLSGLYGHYVGEQLQKGSWSLKDLDAQFKTLIDEKRIPHLVGVEAYENHFILHRQWIPDKAVLVTEESAGRYFGPPVLLRDTSHFTAVKPDDFTHPAHELLVDFCQRYFRNELGFLAH
jgi:hypothetical protein